MSLWSFNFDVHQKDLNKYQYTMFSAQAPLATKKGLVTVELVRYDSLRLTTTFEQFEIRELFGWCKKGITHGLPPVSVVQELRISE